MSYIGLSSRIRLQNVVLATDFSEASNASVEYAASIARNYHGKIYAVHVIPPDVYWWAPPESLPKVEESVDERAQQQMNALLASEQIGDVPHEGVIKHGEIWDGLQPVISEHNADVIVAGTRGRRGFKKLLMGSVAEEILRLSLIPVLTVPPDASKSGRRGVRTVLYPTDFSADSMRALGYALSIAQEFQSCLLLLHVAPSMHNDPDVRNRLQTFFGDELRRLIPAETASWSQHQLVVEFGDPSEEILRCADAYRADLIVMGVRGAGAMVRAATHFGSTAHRVISQAPAPVFSVRELRHMTELNEVCSG